MSKITEGYIKYSNDEERQAAIKYAESLGYTEWGSNGFLKNKKDNCIFLNKDDNIWHDEDYERATGYGLDEIKINTKDYSDSETNCEGCMGPCGECENKQVPTIDQDVLHSLMGHQFMFQKSKYTKTESKDGTITLKPKKKVKVWITIWLNEYRDIEILKSFDMNHYTLVLDSKQKMNWTLIENIKREYEL